MTHRVSRLAKDHRDIRIRRFRAIPNALSLIQRRRRLIHVQLRFGGAEESLLKHVDLRGLRLLLRQSLIKRLIWVVQAIQAQKISRRFCWLHACYKLPACEVLVMRCLNPIHFLVGAVGAIEADVPGAFRFIAARHHVQYGSIISRILIGRLLSLRRYTVSPVVAARQRSAVYERLAERCMIVAAGLLS